MDPFKVQFDRIRQQLSSLTASQKMLTFAMVAIMVMTLVWWGKYAGEPEMEALLPQAISADELPRVESELDAKGIHHVMSGDKLLVPSDRKLEAVAGLMYSHALPRNAKDGFDEVLKNINPFMSEKAQGDLWNQGKQKTLSQIIAEFPDVANAAVVIDPMRELRIDGGIDPSAIVTITMRTGVKASQQLIDAAADVVQGAQASLPRNKIKVVVDGSPRRLRPDSAGGGALFADDQQEAIQHEEGRLEEKIRNQFRDVGDTLMASVTVKLNTNHLEENTTVYDPKTSLQKEAMTNSKTQDTTGAATTGGEPGVGANAPLSVNGGAPASTPGATSTTEENTTHFDNFMGHTITKRINSGGDTTPVAAAVRVPMSYFAAIFKKNNPKVTDPTEAQMRPVIDAELVKMRRDVMACTGLTKEADVSVDSYVDPTPFQPGPVVSAGGVSLAVLGGGHIKEAVLGAMALLSLFMVSMMVKKGAIVPVVATPVAAPGPAPSANVRMGSPPEDVREVGESGSTLDGMELDDDTVRTQQMLDQVSSLVKEDPESAATLVKRWMNRA